MTKRNVASRLHTLLTEAMGQPPDKSVTDTWAALFRINEEHAVRRAHKVADRLILAAEQLDELRELMPNLGISEATFGPQLDRIQQIVHPHHLPSAWKNVQPQISGEPMLFLKLCWDMLPADEEDISAEQFDKLMNDVQTLESSLKTGTTPPELRRAIKRQIHRIRESMSEYRIIGVRALHKVVRETAMDLIDHREEFNAHASDEEVNQLRRVLGEIASMAAKATTVNREAAATSRLLDMTMGRLLGHNDT